MKKKDIIMYSVVGFLILVYFGYKWFNKNKQTNTKKDETFVSSPDYDENGYYVEKKDSKYKKFELFQREKKEESQSKSGEDAETENDGYDIFSGLSKGSGKSVSNEKDSSSSQTINENKDDKVDIFGFNVKKDEEIDLALANSEELKTAKNIKRCPCCNQIIKTKAKRKKKKQKSFSINFGNNKPKVKAKRRKIKDLPKKKKTTFNTIVVPIDSSLFANDSIGLNVNIEYVSMFFSAEFFGSQTVQIDRSVQVKCKESIETPEHFFPSGTIFYGNIKQKGRRFTCVFHRALYNYSDYPIEFEIELFDVTYSEGLLILDYEDEIKDDNTDELLTENAELAEQIAVNRSIAASLVNVSEKSVKALKKKKMYSLDLEDGHEVLLSVKVPKDWFYNYVDKKDKKYRY